MSRKCEYGILEITSNTKVSSHESNNCKDFLPCGGPLTTGDEGKTICIIQFHMSSLSNRMKMLGYFEPSQEAAEP